MPLPFSVRWGGKAYELYQKLFEPVEQMLGGARHVFIVPDGPLQSLPLGVLVTKTSPRVGFIVTNLSRPAERVVAFYNHRGTAEQYIKEGKRFPPIFRARSRIVV